MNAVRGIPAVNGGAEARRFCSPIRFCGSDGFMQRIVLQVCGSFFCRPASVLPAKFPLCDAVLCRAARPDVTGLRFVCCVVGRGSNNKACADKRMKKLYFSQMFFRRRKIV